MRKIPKKIHYFWFGGNEKSELINRCIDSWKRFFPDYEITEWNESNYDVNKNDFIKEAYSCKRWAFVSDYARYDILYNYGGLYFDTDVEVLKPFPDYLFEDDGFTGVESTNVISPGLVFAVKPKHEIIGELLDEYECSHFIVDNKECPITINTRTTELFIKKGFKPDGTIQLIDGIKVYTSDYFCGFDLDVFEPDIRENTLSIHHYASTWGYSSFKVKRTVQKAIKKTIGVNGYRKLLHFIRKLRTRWGRQ